MFIFLLKTILNKILGKRKKIYAEDVIWNNKVYPFYLVTRNSFRYCIQNGLLNRQEILNFKYYLNKCIKNKKKYTGIKFKNDAHEIYVKLKDTSISQKQMIKLNEYFKPMLQLEKNINACESIKYLKIVK